MWILIVLLFTFSNGLVEEDLCKAGFESCRPTGPHPDGFPGNAEEFNQLCTVAVEHITCMLSFMDTCDNHIGPPVEELQDVMESLIKVCDDESPLYEALVENLACYKSAIQNYNVSCSELRKETSLAAGLNDDMKYEDREKAFCLSGLAEVACLITKIGYTCGEFAEKTAFEVVDVWKGSNSICEGVSLEEIIEMVEVLKIDDEVKSRLKTLII